MIASFFMCDAFPVQPGGIIHQNAGGSRLGPSTRILLIVGCAALTLAALVAGLTQAPTAGFTPIVRATYIMWARPRRPSSPHQARKSSKAITAADVRLHWRKRDARALEAGLPAQNNRPRSTALVRRSDPERGTKPLATSGVAAVQEPTGRLRNRCARPGAPAPA
jgi:hypothetical protein